MNKPDFRQIVLQKKRDEQKQVKELFVDTGDYDEMIEIINEKRADKPKIETLPF